MKRPTKFFASIPYVERQARFAKLGPALIVHPERFMRNSIRDTLIAHTGRPTSDETRRILAHSVKVCMIGVNQARQSMSMTWQSIALKQNKGEGFVAR